MNLSGTPNFEYTLSDHLGDTRVTFDSSHGGSTAQQVDDYYPFGIDINSVVSGTKNNYLYNKKELQDGLGQYDYGARFYDPVIGRWTSVDPSSEDGDQESLSPYQYGLDNPSTHDDPDGRCPSCIAFAVGAIVDYGFQVAGNVAANGGHLTTNAFTNVNKTEILVSGGSAALGVGLASKVGEAVSGLSKLSQVLVKAGTGILADAAASAANQKVSTGKVDPTQVAIDAGAGAIVGHGVGHIAENAAKNSVEGKLLAKQADRAVRVGGNAGARASRQVAAKMATTKAANYVEGRAAGAVVASSNIVGGAIKSAIGDDPNKKKN